MKRTEEIKLSPVIGEMIALAYQNLRAAQEYSRGIVDDPTVHPRIKNDFLHIASSITGPLQRIDARIPKDTKDHYNEQIKNADHLRLENVKSIYVRLTPDKQEMAEMALQGILNNEITVEQVKN